MRVREYDKGEGNSGNTMRVREYDDGHGEEIR